MLSSSPVVLSSAYRPEAIWQARHAFFDEGRAAPGLVQDAVLRSWLRCSEQGRAVGEAVAFEPVDRARIACLLDANAELLEAAKPELSDLASSLSDAGYAVLLTDRVGNALAVDGAIMRNSPQFRSAFRMGVDLSELAIGTNAMAVAIREQQPVRILGAEHFYTDAQIFHCSAVPVFDPHGEVVGVVDVSRDMPGMVDSTLWLAARCAYRIERRMFLEQRAHVRIEIDASSDVAGPSSNSGAWLAFGAHGELVAVNRAARSLLGLSPGRLEGGFEDLFSERYGKWVDQLTRSRAGAGMQLRDGVRLRAVMLDDPRHDRPEAPRRHRGIGALRAPASRPVFGDPRLAQDFDRALVSLRAGLSLAITGETGTGKEITARALHAAGPRASGPFVAVNCAAVPPDLLAAELFGHVEGAFTGARREGATGKVEAAHGGTLFLDEIGDMPLSLQATLLRVFDAREVVPLGCTQPREVDIAIVCATHRDLEALVAEGRFREDLMYRVTGDTLHLSPLRERADFEAVLDAVLDRLRADAGRLDETARRFLKSQRWRGNLRQMAHAVQRALAVADGRAVRCEDFGLRDPVRPGATGSGLMHAAKEQAVVDALRQTDGRVAEAARLLGIGRATLYRRMGRKGG